MAIYEKKNASKKVATKSDGGMRIGVGQLPKSSATKVMKNNLSGGATGYTRTSTNRSTGEKKTTSGTLTPTTKSAFVSGAVTGGVGKSGAAKAKKKPIPAGSASNSSVSTALGSKTHRKYY